METGKRPPGAPIVTPSAPSAPPFAPPSALAGSIRWGADGLIPAVVQDRADGCVLMLAYVDREALAATLATGDVHFHSRSRGRLWRKGETSGNVLRLIDLAVDCDRDALLLTVDPGGPTCHRGTRSCFDAEGAGDARPERRAVAASESPAVAASESPAVAASDTPAVPASAPQGFVWLETLWATIADRAEARPAGSYTARLLAGGVDAAARKVTEEATEVLMAAKDDAVAERLDQDRNPAALSGEAADLLYHLLVLLAERGLEPAAVMQVLHDRHGTSGLRSKK